MSLSWPAWMGSDALGSRVVVVLIGAAVRGAILLLLAAVVVRLWPRASAAQRHVVWAVVCCSLLLLPVLPLVVPTWQVSVPVLPAIVAPLVDRVQETDPHTVSLAAGAVSRHITVDVDKPASPLLSEAAWLMLFLGVCWGSGTVVSLAVLADSQRRVRRLVSEALPLTDAHMLDVLTRARSTGRVTRRVPVKLHVSTVPMMCGILWPTIVLPATSRTWTDDRLYNILLHELAHIQRYDCLTQTVAFLACAVYWYNPLVWMAVGKLQTEQEQACDDVVLNAGSRPREYATDLLELTQAFQSTRALSLAALPFARPSELQTRMQSIVDRCRYRSAMSRWGVLAVWSAGLGVMYPLIGITPHMQHAEIRPHITTMENRKMNKIKQTAMVASAAAGLLAPVSRQAQAVVDSQAFQRSEDSAWTKIDFSKIIDGIRYRHDNIFFMPVADTQFHFVVIDGDNGQVVFNSEKDQVVCFPPEFQGNTDRSYYDEPSHTRLTEGWNPKYVHFSMIFHWKYKNLPVKLYEDEEGPQFYHQTIKNDANADPYKIEDCNWLKKTDHGLGIDTAVMSDERYA